MLNKFGEDFYTIFQLNRLSIYTNAMDQHWMHKKNGEVSFGLGLMWGAIGGVVGSYFSSPFFMVSNNRANAPFELLHKACHINNLSMFPVECQISSCASNLHVCLLKQSVMMMIPY